MSSLKELLAFVILSPEGCGCKGFEYIHFFGIHLMLWQQKQSGVEVEDQLLLYKMASKLKDHVVRQKMLKKFGGRQHLWREGRFLSRPFFRTRYGRNIQRTC